MRRLLRYKTAKKYLIIRLLAKMAHSCYFCLFPVFLFNRGYSIFDISILDTIFSIGIVLFEVPTGIIADRMRRDKCIHLSYILMLLAYLFIYIDISFPMLVVANLIMALASAFSSGIIDVWLLDGLKGDGCDEGMAITSGFMQVIENLGLTIGLFLGGLLVTMTIRYAFAGGLVLLIIAVILCFILICDAGGGEVDNIASEKIGEYIINSIKAVTAPFLGVSFTMAIVSFAIASPLNVHWQVFFNQKGIDSEFILSNLYSIRTVLIVIGGIIAGTFKKRESGNNLLIFRIFIPISALALILSAVIDNCWISLGLWSIISITNTIARSFWTAELLSTMGESRRSTLFSINSLIFSFASAAGSLVIGKIADVRGIDLAWEICGCVMILAVVFSFYASKLVKERGRKADE